MLSTLRTACVRLCSQFLFFQCDYLCIAEKKKNVDVGEAMVNTLQNTKYSIDEKLDQSFIQLFRGTTPVSLGAEDDEESESDEEEAEDSDEEEDETSDEEQPGNTQENRPPGVADYADNSDSGEKVGRLDKAGASTPNSRKLTSKKVSSKTLNLPKTGPSEVREFEGGRMRRRAVFEDDGDTTVATIDTEDAKSAEAGDASEDLGTMASDPV